MSATNRETVRDGLAALLSTALVGSGLPAQAVYNYKVGDFQGQSPVVLVTSIGSGRRREGYADEYGNRFRLSVMVFVLYADAGTGWGEDDAEDRLDLLEKSIADVLLTNYSTANWTSIDIAGDTQVVEAEVAGEMYLVELIPVEAYVSD